MNDTFKTVPRYLPRSSNFKKAPYKTCIGKNSGARLVPRIHLLFASMIKIVLYQPQIVKTMVGLLIVTLGYN